jgi:hypothetical protein
MVHAVSPAPTDWKQFVASMEKHNTILVRGFLKGAYRSLVYHTHKTQVN